MERQEKSTTYGNPKGSLWVDIEADEVDLGKALVEDGTGEILKWELWCGVVERGRPSSLRLFRLTPPLSQTRSPGPGPIKKNTWCKVAVSLLQTRKVVLHTDAARAYNLRIPGMLHCNVVRKKKRVYINGKVSRKLKWINMTAYIYMREIL